LEVLNQKLNHDLSNLKERGYNRFSLTSRDGICSKDEVICKQLYGFEDFEFMIGFLEAAFEVKYQHPKENSPLNDMEQIFATLVYTNTTWNMTTIGEMFGINRKTLSKYVNTWLPLLGECGDHMSDFLHFMDESVYDALEPQGYKDIGLRKVAALVDGKDFLTDTVRVDRVLNTAQASNKMHASKICILIAIF
jgi:hypothetical protein